MNVATAVPLQGNLGINTTKVLIETLKSVSFQVIMSNRLSRELMYSDIYRRNVIHSMRILNLNTIRSYREKKVNIPC